MRVLSGLLLSVFAVTGPTACNDDNDKNTATLTVSTDALVLGGEAGESETFTITTTAAWKAVPSGEGFTLDKTEGTGDATVRVTAAAGNWDGYVKQLGSIEIAATSVDGVKTVSVSQDEITPVLPSEVTLVADFTLGASVATPELPPYSTDNFTTGRHEYTIGGYTFAIFVPAASGISFSALTKKTADSGNGGRQGEYHHPVECIDLHAAGSDIAAVAAHNPADHRIVRKIQFADLSLRRRGVGFRNEFEHFGITSGQALDRLYIGIHREAEDVARRNQLFVDDRIDTHALGQVDEVQVLDFGNYLLDSQSLSHHSSEDIRLRTPTL